MRQPPSDFAENDLPLHPGSGQRNKRLEGRMRACEGILRTGVGEYSTQACAKAVQQLRDEMEGKLPATRSMAIIRMPHNTRASHRPKKRAGKLNWLHWGFGIAAGVMVVLAGGYIRFIFQPAQRVEMRLVEVKGDVRILSSWGSSPAHVEDKLRPGQNLISGNDGSVRLDYADGTTIELPGSSSLVMEASANESKTLRLTQGKLSAHVAPQPADAAMIISTPAAKIEVLGTRFSLSAEDRTAWLDVESGKVRLTREIDNSSVQVAAGYSCMATEGTVLQTMQFIKGVNLGGRAVTIDGHRWLSYLEAQADGLVIPNKLSWWNHPGWQPVPQPDPEMTAMLQSGIYSAEAANDGPFLLRQALENGRYMLFVWSTENARDFMRSLTVSVQGVKVATGISSLPLGHWRKYGPYDAIVSDGALTIEVDGATKIGGERHLCGFAIFKSGR